MKRRSGRKRAAIAVAVVLAVSLGLANCTGSTGPAADAGHDALPLPSGITQRLDAALEEALTLSGSSGAIAGVWAPWAGEWVASPGTTTQGGSTPLTPDMRFRIGTNTTAMTCTVLLRLVDEGRVKLGDRVSDYLSRSADVQEITLGQLCSNTSGLADYYPRLAAEFVANPTRQWPPMEILANGLAARRLSGPGGASAQSSTGIILLGLALQSATHQSWPSLYRQYIFGPLGMDDTSFPERGEIEIRGPHPRGYAVEISATGRKFCDRLRDATDLSNSMAWVAGGVVSTIGDMGTWALALARGSLLSDASADAQWTTLSQGPASASWQGYGLGGMQLGPLRGRAGVIPGFLSATLADPNSGLTVVVMLNNSTAGPDFAQALAQRLAAIAATAHGSVAPPGPALDLPWSEKEAAQAMQAGAACQGPVTATG